MESEKNVGEDFLSSLNRVKKCLFNLMGKHKVDGLRQSEFFMLMHIAKICKEQGELEITAGEGSNSPLPGIRISTLSKETNSSMPSVSQFINVLENQGYVERITTKKDRRVVYVSITEAGCELLQIAPRPMLAVLTKTAQEMGDEKTRQFIALMDEFSETIVRLNEKDEKIDHEERKVK